MNSEEARNLDYKESLLLSIITKLGVLVSARTDYFNSKF